MPATEMPRRHITVMVPIILMSLDSSTISVSLSWKQ